jgi:hypothetical protein
MNTLLILFLCVIGVCTLFSVFIAFLFVTLHNIFGKIRDDRKMLEAKRINKPKEVQLYKGLSIVERHNIAS